MGPTPTPTPPHYITLDMNIEKNKQEKKNISCPILEAKGKIKIKT